jgi:hypothetical protein
VFDGHGVDPSPLLELAEILEYLEMKGSDDSGSSSRWSELAACATSFMPGVLFGRSP